MAGGKRVRIQSAHGILIPGGLANSPRNRAMHMFRGSKSLPVTYLAAALVLYGIFCTTRNLLRGGGAKGPLALALPLELDFNHAAAGSSSSGGSSTGSASHFVYEPVGGGDHCPEYGRYAALRHEPFTGGLYNLPFQRPASECRKVVVEEVEEVIREMNKTIKDPDLFRLFENCFPNTLDTSITWTGVAEGNSNEELTFITTGDIHAMWLRDSANQLQSYVSLLKPLPPPAPAHHQAAITTTTADAAEKPSQLASLFRGAINLQARYLLDSPHCNAFQPPAEAAMAPGNDGNPHDLVFPHYDRAVVFECKYELDSLAAFLQLSWDYYSRTKDARFFFSPPPSTTSSRKPAAAATGWKAAVAALLAAAEGMRTSTYTPEGMVTPSPYRFERASSVPTETLGNRGNGSPVRAGTGLVRSAFRPSDDATTYQLHVPSNMMLAKYLELCAEIAALVEREEARVAALAPVSAHYHKDDEDEKEGGEEEEAEGDGGLEKIAVAERMKTMAKEIRKGVDKHGKIKHPDFGEIYAYETDGFFSHSVMDDANLPSLLSSPLTGYVSSSDATYQRTRKFILSAANPYYGHGDVINGTGGPHIGPGMVWPMSLIVGIMTSDDDAEIKDMLRQILSSTDHKGLIHESVNVHNQGMWTRSWFSWANGLFGQMILDLKVRKPHILKTSFQGEDKKNKKNKDGF